jgi:protein CrcB
MVTYLWIALGGALGSVSPASIAIAMIRLTGPQFPWGTILINISGSFIIGLFGTLTGADGRFGVPADARAFVMVGFCGGFTTFSSFSLQTLDLARDGRFGQALANIGLSLLLCLAAVAAGHYAAAAANGSGVRVHAMGGASISKVVVTILDQPDGAPTLLSIAERLLEVGGGGRLQVLAIRTPPATTIMPTEEVLTADRETEIRAEQDHWARQLKSVLDRWSSQPRTRDIEADWIDVEGDLAPIIREYGSRAEGRGRVARAARGRARQAGLACGAL